MLPLACDHGDVPDQHFTMDIAAAPPNCSARAIAATPTPPSPSCAKKVACPASRRPPIQAIADGLLDTLEDQDEIDIIRDLTFPLPTTVIMELAG